VLKGRIYYLSAETPTDRDDWITQLNAALRYAEANTAKQAQPLTGTREKEQRRQGYERRREESRWVR
jgi:hypothetical protein